MGKLSHNLQELSDRIDGKRGPIVPETPEAAPPKGVEWHVDVDPYHLL